MRKCIAIPWSYVVWHSRRQMGCKSGSSSSFQNGLVASLLCITCWCIVDGSGGRSEAVGFSHCL